MAYQTGSIVLVTSNDCKVNATQLCEKLNDFMWTADGGEWLTHSVDGKDVFIHRDDSDTKHPTVFLNKELCYWQDQRGESDTSDFLLKELSNEFTPSILQGWIEIVCLANDFGASAYIEHLRIYADGKALRKRNLFNSASGLEKYLEIYKK